MSYKALYRQWRPVLFKDMVSQEAIIQTLRRQVMTGRVAHAYLFSGTRGTGKTTTAQIFSRAINCLSPQDGEPCGVCANCVALSHENSLDIEEIDAASNNGVDEIRSLRDRIVYPPQNAKYRVYIIDEVHMLSTGAFNALLKTLEEPPAHAVMILATTEPQRLPATILSRCQRFDFKRIPSADISGRLREATDEAGVEADDEALMAIARASDGAMRDAFSILDMCLSLSESVTAHVVDMALGSAGSGFLSAFADEIACGNLAGGLDMIERAARDGRDMAVLARELCAYFRAMMIAAFTGEKASEILEVSAEQAERYAGQCRVMGEERTLRAMECFARVEPEMRWASQPRSLLELALVRVCRPQDSEDIDSLRQRIERLEKELSNATIVPSEKMSVQITAQPAATQHTAPPAATRREEKPSMPAADVNEGAVWKGALQSLRKGLKMAQYSALTRARLQALRDGIAYVAFEPQDDVFYKMMQLEQNAAILAQALSDAAGMDIRPNFIIAGQEVPVPGPQIKRDDWVDDVIGVFGRENVDLLEKGENIE